MRRFSIVMAATGLLWAGVPHAGAQAAEIAVLAAADRQWITVLM